MTGMLPLHVDAVDLAEQADRRDEARQADADARQHAACGCRACDPGWWADEDQYEREQDRP